MKLGFSLLLLFSLANCQGVRPYNPCKGNRIGEHDWMVLDPYDCTKFYMCHGERAFHQSCPFGTSFRRSRCHGPRPSKVKNCFKGIWDQWSEWGECSVSCGQGFRERTRSCQGNQHGNGLRYSCNGPRKDYESCSLPDCIEDLSGEWDEWSDWSPCSATCGLAKRQRQRDCRGVDCVGEDTEIQSCTDLPQCQWDNWSEWSECSTTCGVGRKTRFRLCNDGRNCIGDSLQYETCPTNPTCPQPTEGQWMTWSMWSTCSTTCGDGIKQRVRQCRNKMNCNGPRVERQPCQEPVDLHDHPECNEL
eukprot:07993.XXX_283722_282649_1 [CDS] Oithona nana genome sequencing.